ncbi:TetR family transcriptional regulator [Nocardioides sp. SYSU DS0651]|uniref:TetR/AcrR family transcriptional regulator n=1 Tax=Nocardioides sp. SYSU DS0651 TaxID=3415955 RepID=UPI003F4BD8CD
MTSTSSTADARHLRPAGRATRAAIEDAARALFAERGFESTSVRAIAATAGVDPALVIRHFGTKEALFLRCVDTATGVRTVVEGPLEGMGRRLVGYFVDKPSTGFPQRYVALVQAAHRPQVRAELHRQTAEGFVAPLAPRLEGAHRELRVALLVAQVGGLLSMLYLQQDPVLTAAEPGDLVDTYGPAIQQLITPAGR